MEVTKLPECRHPKLVCGLLFSVLLNFVILALVIYSAQRIMKVEGDINEMRQIQSGYVDNHNAVKQEESKIVKREILSGSDQINLSHVLSGALRGSPGPQGPAGPLGPAGLPGRDGRDGHPGQNGIPGTGGKDGIPGTGGKDGIPGKDGDDFSSLKLLREAINETVIKEWTQLSSNLPKYGGATYTRWGKKSCPDTSKMIYNGQMASSDHRSPGGGANYLCLPADPEYDSYSPAQVWYSVLGRVWYQTNMNKDVFQTPSHQHLVPCAVCEANQRVTEVMIPAAVRCPTDWVLEYKGYVMSMLDTYSTDGSFVKDSYYKTSYVCVDQKAESLTSKPNTEWTGSPIYLSRAQCSGAGALGSCPPYQSDKALSCVVCTK